MFENKVGNCIEQTLAVIASELNADLTADMWESFISTYPSKSWSPDKRFILVGKSTSLAEIWMHSHDEDWVEFISKVTVEFPVLEKDIILEAAMAGIRVRYTNESVVMVWIGAYIETLKLDKNAMNNILCAAIGVNFLEVAKLAIDNGAIAQRALHLVQTRKSLNLLMGNGADVSIKLNVDDFRSPSWNWHEIKKFDAAVTSGESVCAYVVCRDASSFCSQKDRQYVLDDITAKIKSSISAMPNKDDALKELFLSGIKSARKSKEIFKVIKNFSPMVWEWKFEDDKNSLMLLSETNWLSSVAAEFSKQIPESLWVHRDLNGISTLETILLNSKNIRWDLSKTLFNELKSKTPIAVEISWKLMMSSLEGEYFPSCPVGNWVNESGLTEPKTASEDFWIYALKNDGMVSCCELWIENIKNSESFYTEEAHAWGSEMKTSLKFMELMEEYPIWGVLRGVLLLMEKLGEYEEFNSSISELETREIIKKEMLKLAKIGVNIRDIMSVFNEDGIDNGGMVKDIADECIAFVERELLNSKVVKNIGNSVAKKQNIL